MALILSTPNPYDGVADNAYWKIIQLNINWLSKAAHIDLACWINEQARTEGKSPIKSVKFDWSGDDFPFVDSEPQNEREQAYNKIKTTDDFNQATDA